MAPVRCPNGYVGVLLSPGPRFDRRGGSVAGQAEHHRLQYRHRRERGLRELFETALADKFDLFQLRPRHRTLPGSGVPLCPTMQVTPDSNARQSRPEPTITVGERRRRVRRAYPERSQQQCECVAAFGILRECGLRPIRATAKGQTFIGASDVSTDASGNASFGPLVFHGCALRTGRDPRRRRRAPPAARRNSRTGLAAESRLCDVDGLVSSINPSTVGSVGQLHRDGDRRDSPPAACSSRTVPPIWEAPVALSGRGVAHALHFRADPKVRIRSLRSTAGMPGTPTGTSAVVEPSGESVAAAGATTTTLTSSQNPSTLGQIGHVHGDRERHEPDRHRPVLRRGRAALGARTATRTWHRGADDLPALTQGTHSITRKLRG